MHGLGISSFAYGRYWETLAWLTHTTAAQIGDYLRTLKYYITYGNTSEIVISDSYIISFTKLCSRQHLTQRGSVYASATLVENTGLNNQTVDDVQRKQYLHKGFGPNRNIADVVHRHHRKHGCYSHRLEGDSNRGVLAMLHQLR